MRQSPSERSVFARNDHIVELPDRAVPIHAGDGVVDVHLAFDHLRLAHAAAVFVEFDRVDDLVLLGDFHPEALTATRPRPTAKTTLPSNQTRSMTWSNGLLYVSDSTPSERHALW